MARNSDSRAVIPEKAKARGKNLARNAGRFHSTVVEAGLTEEQVTAAMRRVASDRDCKNGKMCVTKA